MSHSVELNNIQMVYGKTRVLDNVSITVEGGEFFSILGPSGCGKTTLLRMIAGFIQPSAGCVRIGGIDMAGLGPNQRPTAMVFQSLALFPLMRIWENIAFGLEVRGVPKLQRRKRADELLELVALPGYGDRFPDELSGGQKQRVAIARALAVSPQVLLLDEPLSALDLKLRQHMRIELRALQKRTGVTFIYITHDQSEALAMSDRVAVMSAGRLEQVATPRELYENPATPFVARFVGETNLIGGTVSHISENNILIDGPLGRFHGRANGPIAPRSKVHFYIRPEALRIDEGTKPNTLPVSIERIDIEGASATVHLMADHGVGLQLTMSTMSIASIPAVGTKTSVCFDTQHALAMAEQ